AVISPLMVFLIIYTIVNYSLVKGIYSDEADRHARQVVVGFKAGIDGYFMKAKQIPVILARLMETSPGMGEQRIDNTIKAILGKNGDVYGSCVAFEPGEYRPGLFYQMRYACRDTGKTPPEVGVVNLDFTTYRYHEYEWYSETKKKGAFYWTKPYYDAGCGDVIMVTGSEPFFDRTGRFTGVATVDVTLDYINTILSKYSLSRNSFAFALDGEGNFLYHPAHQPSFVKGPDVKTIAMKNINTLPGLANLKKAIASEDSDTVRHTDIDLSGEEYVVYHTRLATTGWSIGIFVPGHELYSGSRLFLLALAISFFVIIIAAVIVYFASKNILAPLQNIRETTEEISAGNLNREIEIVSDDEIGVISGHFNEMIRNFRELLIKMGDASKTLGDSILEMNVSSKEISSTANQQAASVKEIVTTMEDSDSLAKSVSERVDEVARMAKSNREFVENGFAIIKETLGKMEEINRTNDETIKSVRELGERIDNIWEIVNIINGIADQTKIIAFNAELEASSAGETGKSFMIVAGEIRRLADNIVASTGEIHDKIGEIQKSSDYLLSSSEKGTERIRTGWDLSVQLRSVFEEILGTSETSAEFADRIAVTIKQQVMAFEQILLTLKQISNGIDDFVISTKSTAITSETLKAMSEDMRKIISRYII
nr:methyl-accepting chemotaxis protein [Spirochaetota bacterium]